ncbi:MAG: flavin reductase family protein [Candidatus Eremiobacteraeota bacterium]|nr:flavin reductase family protein [Candidatus Eremiobacteraeota bacterium]
MLYDFSQITGRDAYKLVVSTIVPRPIAWVTSQNTQGQLNVAPFSFFNAMAGDPPTLVLGIGSREEGGPKDTLRNILETGQFVVNLVNEELAKQMNITATPFSYGVSEAEKAALATTPSSQVRPPRLAASPVSFECELSQTVAVSETSTIVIARALACHIDDRYMLNAEKYYVNTPELKLVGRIHGAGWYTTTHELFQMERYTVAQWETENGG